MKVSLQGRIAKVTWIALSLLVWPIAVGSQANHLARTPVKKLKGELTCKTCQIRLVKSATISDNEFELETSHIAIARNSKGIFLVGGKNGNIGLFDPSGKFLRAVGRRGGGPGEFQSIWKIHIGYQDSVVVQDMFAHRITVFDPDMRRVVRTFTFQDYRGMIPSHNGSFVTSGSFATRNNSGRSLHLVSGNGVVLKSASADSAEFFRRQPERMLGRSLALLNGNTIIAAPMHRYRIELWSPDLKLNEVFERDVNEFPPLSEELLLDVPSRTALPMQLLSVVPGGQDGIVVAELLSGTINFKPDPALVGRKGEIPSSAIATYAVLNEYVDTTIEFIDLKSSSVLASRRFRGRYVLINQAPEGVRAPLYCIVQETPQGTEVIEIVRAEITGRSGVARHE